MQFHNLGVVTDFINWAIQNPVLGVIALAAMSPLAVVMLGAIVVERRSLKPLPSSYTLGNFFMIWAVGVILAYASIVDASRWSWWFKHGPIVTLIIVLAFYLLMRKVFDGPMYEMTPGATANSASKIMYDMSSYVVYPYILILVGVPTVIESLRTNEVAGCSWWSFAGYVCRDAGTVASIAATQITTNAVAPRRRRHVVSSLAKQRSASYLC